ncbi:protease inhibitor I42 family protein [Acinetobacter sp. CFCC 10889]|uniref:protease inhibitor I42 family protein n=1 Tax=Acinetobacter sp. CFCC 10889 TaxID=1775557 RepID=UPI000DCFA4B6|nr:protease inhibitor I42 family protein [Acinetobacter sp. CFCC 10889]
MKGFCVVATLLTGMVLGGCQSSSPTVDGKTHQYSLKQHCPTLMEMNVGEVVVFTAPENPSTGYQWKLLQPVKNFKIEETYLQNEAEEGSVGVGGTKVFRFTALQAGHEYIELVHVRSWESTKQPDQQWQCRIRIS